MGFIPKVSQAIFTAILIIVCLLLGTRFGGRYQSAMNWGAFAFAIITAIILYLLILDGLDRHTDTITRFMESFSKLDDEARIATAFAFPAMRYRMKRGKVREFFEDTNVPIEMFRLFLTDSNDRYIAPERNWNTSDRPRWAWIEIKEYLESNKYIIADSASGSHSWLWSGNSYRHLMAYWMAGREIMNMDQAEAVS